jgi:hypothetical protein
MKTKPTSKPVGLSKSESGVALIITLAAIVLVTMAAVAFFSRATANRLVESSRANQMQSTQLARTGVDYVTTQFLSDIVGNSTAVTVGNSTIYRPKNTTNMVPLRSVHSDLSNDAQFQNLVLQSLGGNSSAGPAPNGRSISTTAWNAPMLLGGDGFISNNTVPTWIYVNRDGSTSTTANATTAIGRLAFNAYKIGGLLDINAFGHGGNFSANGSLTKGTPASAVLDALPGISSSANKGDNSLSWPPTWRIPGNWSLLFYDPAGNSTNRLKHYIGSGWRAPFSQNGTVVDRFFATRQDLIRYAQANPSTFSVNGTQIPTLPYLTHWSRDVDLPTHEPTSGRPKVQNNLTAGGNDAFGLDDALNPSLLTITKTGGTPAITKRFPLSRLSMVSTPVPPAYPTASASDILNYFGLTWDSTNNRWNYDHGDASDILPLSDIPANREPDFVELLKAAIGAGSLGKQFGTPFPLAYSSLGLPAQKGGLDGSVNYQLIQIAANIIDQYDSDGYPTRIQFDGREFYGVEDMPRLHVAADRSFRAGNANLTIPGFAAPDGTVLPLQVWMIQPQLWNPHDSGATGATSSNPVNFRITARSTADLGVEGSWFWKPTPDNMLPYPQNQRRATFFTNLSNNGIGAANIGGPDCTQSIVYNGNQFISFSMGNNGLFREPTYLVQVGYPTGSNANGSPNNTDMKVTDLIAPNTPDTIVDIYYGINRDNPVINTSLNPGSVNAGTTQQALGFVVGYMPGQVGGRQWGAYHRATGGPLSLELQYSQGGNWWTIDKQQICLTPLGRNFSQETYMATRVDPRSDRWGSFYLWQNFTLGLDPAGAGGYLINFQIRNFSITSNPSPNLYHHLTKYTTVNSTSSSIATGWTGVGNAAALGRVQRNSVTSDPFRYTDPDGVQRRGVAAYATDNSSAGWPMNSANTTASYNPTFNPSSRPIVLNRPFRSLAELGNVFRGTPWRNLDFMTPESGDRVLLDLFTLEEAPSDNLVGGRVNLNMASPDVLTALIQGAGMVDGTSTISKATANDMALEFQNYVTGTAPGQGYLKDRSEIVGRWVAGTTYAGAAQEMAAKLTDSQRPLPRNRDTIVASLADVGTVRTWNFLIDVVAQSGSVVDGQFIPQGEARVWDCVAIDRFTARVVARSSESINN